MKLRNNIKTFAKASIIAVGFIALACAAVLKNNPDVGSINSIYKTESLDRTTESDSSTSSSTTTSKVQTPSYIQTENIKIASTTTPTQYSFLGTVSSVNETLKTSQVMPDKDSLHMSALPSASSTLITVVNQNCDLKTGFSYTFRVSYEPLANTYKCLGARSFQREFM